MTFGSKVMHRFARHRDSNRAQFLQMNADLNIFVQFREAGFNGLRRGVERHAAQDNMPRALYVQAARRVDHAGKFMFAKRRRGVRNGERIAA